ncbi:MAG: hypothetical protein JSW34_10125 [Candidatus Zixiibacteriota bacterium]|nr:MAG: hypothetical protein JSW34_10125 [candidate division Zixibacteria bacterium]
MSRIKEPPMMSCLRNLALGLAVLGLSCGSRNELDEPPSTRSLLAESFKSGELQRVSDARLFVGESLYEYINGGAELYHAFNFVEVATADYSLAGSELVADIYLFDNADHAFGLYSQVRPDNPNHLPLGVEGFGSETNLVFVKGRYVLMLTGFEATRETAAALRGTAQEFSAVVPGETKLPAMFSVLPGENAVPFSEKMFAESFLGIGELTEVYSRRYAIGADTLTLFVAPDSGEKLAAWRAQAGADETTTVDLGLSAQAHRAMLAVTNSYYGQIIALNKDGYLAGAVGYTDGCREFAATWLNTVGSAR